jgi:hypothetical protein
LCGDAEKRLSGKIVSLKKRPFLKSRQTRIWRGPNGGQFVHQRQREAETEKVWEGREVKRQTVRRSRLASSAGEQGRKKEKDEKKKFIFFLNPFLDPRNFVFSQACVLS